MFFLRLHRDSWLAHQDKWNNCIVLEKIDEQLKCVKEVRWTNAAGGNDSKSKTAWYDEQVGLIHFYSSFVLINRRNSSSCPKKSNREHGFPFSSRSCSACVTSQCSLQCLCRSLFKSTFPPISSTLVSGHDTIHFPFLQLWLAWDVNARDDAHCSFIAVGGLPTLVVVFSTGSFVSFTRQCK